MRKERKNEKGFTMVELIVVVTIIGIIGALLVPAYGTMAAKARLTTDIATVKTIKRTVDTYRVQESKAPTKTSYDDLIKELADAGYIDSKTSLQTGCGITVDTTKWTIKLDTANLSASEYKGAYDKLDTNTKTDWCSGEPKK